jgi:hypothetical protein
MPISETILCSTMSEVYDEHDMYDIYDIECENPQLKEWATALSRLAQESAAWAANPLKNFGLRLPAARQIQTLLSSKLETAVRRLEADFDSVAAHKGILQYCASILITLSPLCLSASLPLCLSASLHYHTHTHTYTHTHTHTHTYTHPQPPTQPPTPSSQELQRSPHSPHSPRSKEYFL